ERQAFHNAAATASDAIVDAVGAHFAEREQRHRFAQHEGLEVLGLAVRVERRFGLVDLVEQDVVRIVLGAVRGERDVAGLGADLLRQRAQDCRDLLLFAGARAPAGDDDVAHGASPAAPSADDNSAAAAASALARLCSAWNDSRHTGPEMPMAPTTWPLKSRTGMAAQRTSSSNSPSSKPIPDERTSSISCTKRWRSTIVFDVSGLNSTRSR